MTTVILAAALAISGWKGETVSFRVERTNESDKPLALSPAIAGLPADWKTEAGVMRPVRYVTKAHGTEYATGLDRVE